MAKRRVALIGKGATAANAPYDDSAWEIWGLAWVRYPRADLLFDVHSPGFKADPPFDTHFNSHKNPAYFERVNGEGIPVMCLRETEGQGKFKFWLGEEYPLDAAAADLPRLWLDCTISYMVALAILRGYDEISLWGCHFMAAEEFRVQLPSVTWLIGIAEGRGVKVSVGPGAPLLMSGYEAGRYGVDQNFRFGGRGERIANG